MAIQADRPGSLPTAYYGILLVASVFLILCYVFGDSNIIYSKFASYEATPGQINVYVVSCFAYAALGIVGIIRNTKIDSPMWLSRTHDGLFYLCIVLPIAGYFYH